MADDRAIFNALPDGAILVDERGAIQAINPAAERLLGVVAAEWLGRMDAPFVPLAAHEYFRWNATIFTVRLTAIPASQSVLMNFHARTARVWQHEVADLLRELNSMSTPIRGCADLLELGTYGPLADAQREPVATIKQNARGLQAVLRTLMELGRLDRSWLAYEAAADDEQTVALDEGRGRILTWIRTELTFELLHPLRGALSALRLVLYEPFGPLSEKQAAFLQMIQKNLTATVDLIEDMRAIVAIELDPLHYAEYLAKDLHNIVEIIEAALADLPDQTIHVRIEAGSPLPLVFCNQRHIQRAVQALVSELWPGAEAESGLVIRAFVNAGGMIQLDIFAVAPAANARSPHRPESMFEHFRDTRLDLARRSCALHGGEIWFASQEGAGSTFSLALPLGERAG